MQQSNRIAITKNRKSPPMAHPSIKPADSFECFGRTGRLAFANGSEIGGVGGILGFVLGGRIIGCVSCPKG